MLLGAETGFRKDRVHEICHSELPNPSQLSACSPTPECDGGVDGEDGRKATGSPGYSALKLRILKNLY